MSQNSFSLIIHGGAGEDEDHMQRLEKLSFKSLETILNSGKNILEKGASALDVVQHCVNLLENDPLYNAGFGACENLEGAFELDSAIMDGKSLNAGAVAAITNCKNPVSLARKIMEETHHVLLAGNGAEAFAKKHKDTPSGIDKISLCEQGYFQKAQKEYAALIEKSKNHGTVGAVARDINGNIAAATSTGGWEEKMFGRVGDCPLIGAGTYADNQSVGISCTGEGESFIIATIASYASFLAESQNLDATEIAQKTINRLVEKTKGNGGFILIDKNGKPAAASSHVGMRCGWLENGNIKVTRTPAIQPTVKRA